ncbi:MAG: hypothetical protein M1821_002577 [Bathelium mastoideum]|nr:MAG: hypothetical protein M1821_002577 [Bathelium mastoideum]
MASGRVADEDVHQVDVLVVGGGPVGLLTAYQLALFADPAKPRRIRIIEQYAKSSQDNYGRAITLFPRSAELLDQLGLAEALAQQCFACRETASYNAKGEPVEGRGWDFMRSMGEGKTKWDFALVLRQKYQEEIFRKALEQKGVEVETSVKLIDVAIDPGVKTPNFKVTATLKHLETGITEHVQSRFLIGADGGRSSVRKLLEIPFDGSMTEDNWVRIDGLVKTTLPKPRAYVSLESPTHGNVLWAALDRGATRIGFAFTSDRQKEYPEFNEEAAVKEAQAAVKPFELEFERVDWHTIYAVGQRVARQFSYEDCVFLVGDACHTHSSGAAQGLNTGIHDAVNLAWKLSLVLGHVANPSLLSTYELERRPNVEKLINYDKDIARLMTMQLPIGWKGDPNADPNEVLGGVLAEAASFSSGLGISYSAKDANNTLNCYRSNASALDKVQPGQRLPDIILQKPGTFENTRLHAETPNRGLFYVLLLTGSAYGAVNEIRQHLDATDFSMPVEVEWLTVLLGKWPSPYEILGGPPIGKYFCDVDGSGHAQFSSFAEKQGLIAVLRPDGWLGCLLPLEPLSINAIKSYFENCTVGVS